MEAIILQIETYGLMGLVWLYFPRGASLYFVGGLSAKK